LKPSKFALYSHNNLSEKGFYFEAEDSECTIDSPNTLTIKAPQINIKNEAEDGTVSGTITDLVQTVNNLNGGGGGGNGSNGKYSQICKAINDGQVRVDGDNSSIPEGVSVISGSSQGSLTFTPSELSLGSSYHVKIGGIISMQHNQGRKLRFTYKLMGPDTNDTNDDTIIYTSQINDEDLEVENKNSAEYVYESELDFTVYNTGTNGELYANGQILYVNETQVETSIKGTSSEKYTTLDLSQNLTLDIEISWEPNADSNEYIINKMVRVTRMF